MKRRLSLLTVALGCVLLLSSLAPARADTFPGGLLVQSYLHPENGDTGGGRNRQVDLLLRLVDEQGAVDFVELHCGVAAVGRDGRFEVVLGSTDPKGNPLVLPFDKEYWLELTLCSEPAACNGASGPEPSACTDEPLRKEKLEALPYARRALVAAEAGHALTADDADTVDGEHAAAFVHRSGDVMSGPLTLPGDPSDDLHASTKAYVDNKAAEEGVLPDHCTLKSSLNPEPGYERYYRSGDTVVMADPMLSGRGRTAAAAVEVDGKIYLFGGYDASGPSKLVEAYDLALDTWHLEVSMPTARFGAAAAHVNGKIYVIGGTNLSGWVNTNESYDPSTGTWTTEAPMPTARSELAAVVYGDKIYAMGGSYISANEVYDTSTNTWAARKAGEDGSTVGTRLSGGPILTVTLKDLDHELIPAIYDPETDQWTWGRNRHYSSPFSMVISGAAYGGRIAVWNGFNLLAYYEQADAWTEGGFLPIRSFHNNLPAVAYTVNGLHLIGGAGVGRRHDIIRMGNWHLHCKN